MSFAKVLCVYAAMTLGAAAAQAQGDAGARGMSVVWHQGRLSVNATGVPFRELVAGVAAKTGVEVQVLGALPGNASVHFANLTLRAGLEALLSPMNYVMFEKPSGSGGWRTVVILVGRNAVSPSSMASGQERGTATGASEAVAAPRPDIYQVVERLSEQGDVRALREAAVSSDPMTQALAMQRLARQEPAEALRVAKDASGSAEVAQRLLAVQVLSGLDSPEATDTLAAALQDTDLGVRHAALIGLMGRPSRVAIPFLVQALQDREVSIRLLALGTLAERGGAGEHGVRIALNDDDPAVRKRAQEALAR
jgi:HEAT repeats